MENKQNTSLLVMNMQPAILRMLPDTTALLSNVSKAIAHARSNKIPVMYARVGFRKGAPELSMSNKGLSANRERFINVDADEFLKIHPAIMPLENEIIVTKRRVSAFTGSDLEVVLRSLGIQHIVLAGVSTSGVVLSTTREAADKDYRVTILSDCCADTDEEVHRVLTTKIFLRQADVMKVEDWSNT